MSRLILSLREALRSTGLRAGPPTITERMARIDIVADSYIPHSGTDPAAFLADVLADLRHWADGRGLDFDEASWRGEMHWEAERDKRSES